MVSQGVPDENAARLSQEMSDLAVELPKSQKVGAEPLHAASKALVAVRTQRSTNDARAMAGGPSSRQATTAVARAAATGRCCVA